jgi:hypothetical protein
MPAYWNTVSLSRCAVMQGLRQRERPSDNPPGMRENRKMAVRRDEVETKWRSLLQGELSREDVALWVARMEEECTPGDMMVAIGLQKLAHQDLRTWQRDSRRHGAHAGEYLQPMERMADLFERWKTNCFAYDDDPSGAVYFSEDAEYSDDFRITHWRGTFSGSWQGVDVFNSPSNLTAAEAIAWGRARSSRALMRTRDDVHYAAGTAVPREIPPWPENFDMKEGLEWMDRTDADDPIEWDVRVSPYVPPHTATEAFLAQFRITLEGDREINLQSVERPPDTPRVPGNPVAVLRLEARTEDEAKQKATKLVLPLFSKALRNTVEIGRFGWTMSVNAHPAE